MRESYSRPGEYSVKHSLCASPPLSLSIIYFMPYAARYDAH